LLDLSECPQTPQNDMPRASRRERYVVLVRQLGQREGTGLSSVLDRGMLGREDDGRLAHDSDQTSPEEYAPGCDAVGVVAAFVRLGRLRMLRIDIVAMDSDNVSIRSSVSCAE